MSLEFTFQKKSGYGMDGKPTFWLRKINWNILFRNIPPMLNVFTKKVYPLDYTEIIKIRYIKKYSIYYSFKRLQTKVTYCEMPAAQHRLHIVINPHSVGDYYAAELYYEATLLNTVKCAAIYLSRVVLNIQGKRPLYLDLYWIVSSYISKSIFYINLH